MSEDDEDKFETVFPLPLWFVLLCALLFGLPGCATEAPKSGPRIEVCEVQLIGQSPHSGLPVVAVACVSPEKFAKSQQ